MMSHFSAKQKIWYILGIVLLVTFVAFTFVVTWVDVNQVGLSHLNQFFWQLCGPNNIWKWVTNCLGYCLLLMLVVLLICQLVQWMQRNKSLRRVDKNLLALDVVCRCLLLVYLFFEIVVINYRPFGDKASYPSSHAMLFTTILPLLIYQVWHYLKSKPWRVILTIVLIILLLVGLVGRLLSGVHWFTDILAGIIIGSSLNCFYMALMAKKSCVDDQSGDRN